MGIKHTTAGIKKAGVRHINDGIKQRWHKPVEDFGEKKPAGKLRRGGIL
jgi:hypothetical protein